MLGIGGFRQRMVDPAHALPGRDTPMVVPAAHHVHGRPLAGAFEGLQVTHFGMGCFWGAERRFWTQPGVFTTAAGYAGGYTPNPTYREVCSGETGHAEVVLVAWDPAETSFDDLLKVFWESHDPTQGMRQGNDTGSQYRSVIHCTTRPQFDAAVASRDAYAARLQDARQPVDSDPHRRGQLLVDAQPVRAHLDSFRGVARGRLRHLLRLRLLACAPRQGRPDRNAVRRNR